MFDPLRTCGHQESVNVLLGDQVGTTVPLPKGSKPEVQDGLPHLLWVHSEDFGGFFCGEVLHCAYRGLNLGQARSCTPMWKEVLCNDFTGSVDLAVPKIRHTSVFPIYELSTFGPHYPQMTYLRGVFKPIQP